MDLGMQLLFFLGSLGAFNGFLMGMYFLFFAKPRRIQNQFFGLLIIMLSIRIGKSVLLYFDRGLPKTLLQFGLSACVFIGPFLFFYLRSILYPKKKISKEVYWQIGGLFLLTLGIGILFPYTKRPDLWNPEMVQGIYAIWVIYIVAAAILMRPIYPIFWSKSESLTIVQKWVLVVFSTNALVCLVYNSILYIGFPSYILGPITFSFVFYGLIGFLLLFPNSRTIIEGEKERYNNKKIIPQEGLKVKRALQQLMIEKRLFENPDLKLQHIATELKVTPHYLSQFLNEHLEKGFADYINDYRIIAACDLLQSKHNLTMEGVGQEVGFRSKSTFYTAFKKRHGVTPNQFSKGIKTADSGFKL